jgi:hypothetical protein
MAVYLTFDYELFFGSETGTVKKCMIDPTEQLLAICEKQNIPMTFFMDVGMLLKMYELKEEFPELANDYQAIISQINRMEALGCAVQLHIHPHWENATYVNGKWSINVNGCYKLSDFSQADASLIIEKYYHFLQALVQQKITSYRAGGWCIQPFDHVKDTFQRLGVTIDSSVFPGGKFESPHYAFDFSSVKRYTQPYRFDSDVCEVNKAGYFTELPISSWNYSPLFYWRLYLLGRLFPKQHKMLGDGNFLAQPGRKKSVLTSFTWNHVSCDGYYAGLLQRQFRCYQRKKTDFVVIAHPKGLTRFSIRKLEQFIARTKVSTEFSTVNQVVCS